MPDGKDYDIAGDIWVLSEVPGFELRVIIDWTLLNSIVASENTKSLMSTRAISFLKLYVLERLSNVRNALKPTSAKCYLHAVLHFARWLAANPGWLSFDGGFSWNDLTEEMFEAWLNAEYRKKRKGNSAMLIRRFYLWGADPYTGHSDFSASLALRLSAIRIKKNAIGVLVESRNSRQGPYTREESDLMYEACKTGAGKDQDRAIAWTLLETGLRPKQMYLLTNMDLEVIESGSKAGDFDGNQIQTIYRLRIRKLKQRGDGIVYHFLPLSGGCAQLLLKLRRPESNVDDRLFWWISSSYRASINQKLQSFSKDADLRSPRLKIENPDIGGPFYEHLPMTSRRFRYAIASDRIARGELPAVVASALGHNDIETLYAYVETSPSIADDFKQATDYVIEPLIDLMEGRSHPSEESLLANAVPLVSSKIKSSSDVTIYKRGTARKYYEQKKKQSLLASTVIHLVPDLDRSESRIKELVAIARRKFPLIYSDQHFDEQIWNVTHLRERSNVTTVVSFGFTTLHSTVFNRNGVSARSADALPTYFAEVIKSYLVISNHVSLNSNTLRLYAARHFWNFLTTRQYKKSKPFKWGNLTEYDIFAFEKFLTTYRTRKNRLLNSETILLLIYHIQRLVDFLACYGICRHIDYIPQTPSTRAGTHLLLDEKELAAERKLPSPGVLESVADIYYRLTTAPSGEVSEWMLIFISAVAIMVLTGLRIGEIVTLPFDCEVEEKRPKNCSDDVDINYYGIRYWVEKAQNKMMRIKWVSPTAESVVRECIARIKRLTAAARERVRILEADPTKVPLPQEIATRLTLTKSEVLALLGHIKNTSPVRDPLHLLPLQNSCQNSYYYVKDFEAYLLSRRVPHLYTVQHDDGTFQMLSESLLILFSNQTRCWQTKPCLLLVEPLKATAIATYLSRRDGLFKTYGSKEWQKRVSANPHCFRHWLIHIAYKGGMETHLVLRYFAKRHFAGIADYIHFSTTESDPYAPVELSEEEFFIPERST